MDLLEKASVILTPTAYNNGEALCVKPSDGSGDFDFSRNSAATRVNAQGLVENVQILSSNLVQNPSFSNEGVQEISNGSFSQEGSELVTNGDFSNGSTGWILDTGWSIQNGQAVCNGIGINSLQQNTPTIIGKTYKLTFDVISDSASDFLIISTNFGDTYIQGSETIIGTNTFYITPTNGTGIRFRVANGNTLSIDNVSVREVGQDWTLGTGWSIGENKAVATNVDNTFLAQNSILTSGKTYKITYTIQDYSSGSVRFRSSLVNGSTNSGNGTYTDYIVSGGTQFALQGLNTFNGSITNISVKEVGMDWDLQTGWSIGNDVVTTDGTSGKYFSQVGVLEIGKTYKYSFDVLNNGNGIIDGRLRDQTSGSVFNFSSEGTYTGTFTSLGTFFNIVVLSNNTASFSITNISIIEISADTNLPRINYENFSYQDALGSEQVVNGSFDSDTAWLKQSNWTIGNGFANSNGSGLIYQTSVSYIDGKTYKVTFDADITSGSGTVRLGNTTAPTSFANGSNEFYLQTDASNTTRYIFFNGTSLVGSIDNVSVKEYLGQEVVPNSGCGSWLMEGQSTNLITYSEEITQFDQNNVTTLNNQTISADGTQNASKVTKLGASANDRIKEDISISSATSYNVSVFLKNDTIDGTTTLGIRVVGGTLFRLGFDWSGSTPSISASHSFGARTNEIIENYGNGWYRVGFSFVSDGTDADFELDLDRANPNATTSLFVWGAQLEQQSYATSYIPTSGSTVTRNQDVCTNGGSLATINSTSGTLYFEGAALANDGTNRAISINDGTSTTRVAIILGNSNNQIRGQVRIPGTSFDFSTFAYNFLNFNKIAISYKLNEFKMYVNGTLVSTDTSGNTPIGLSELSFNIGGGVLPFYGKTKALAVWKEALTDQELTELTTI
jgi:hypothetical protein